MTVTCISQHWNETADRELKVSHNDETDMIIVDVNGSNIELNRAQLGMLVRNCNDQLVSMLSVNHIRQLIVKQIVADKYFGSITADNLLYRYSENGIRESIDREHAITIAQAYIVDDQDCSGLIGLIKDLKVLEEVK